MSVFEVDKCSVSYLPTPDQTIKHQELTRLPTTALKPARDCHSPIHHLKDFLFFFFFWKREEKKLPLHKIQEVLINKAIITAFPELTYWQ